MSKLLLDDVQRVRDMTPPGTRVTEIECSVEHYRKLESDSPETGNFMISGACVHSTATLTGDELRLRLVTVPEPLPAPKRFLIFVGAHYYPSGGWDDYKGSADHDAVALGCIDAILAERLMRDQLPETHFWWQVVDSTSGAVVHHSGPRK